MKRLHKAITSAAVATTATFTCLPSSAEAATLSRSNSFTFSPRYVTAGEPDDYLVEPGTGFDGVVDLSIETTLGNFGCSGSLLTSGLHILTAAHCLTDNFGASITNGATVYFDLSAGRTAINATNFFIYPDWDGFLDFESFGGDIAILELETEAPDVTERYDIYRDTDEIGQIGTKVGYGLTGNGNQGDVLADGLKRSGQNIYDAPGEIFESPEFGGVIPGAFLGYDFDNGLAANDAFGFHYGIPDLGLGLNEVNSAPGDSGGPTFINGLIAGLTSFGDCFFYDLGECTGSDIDTVLNSSFGEFSVDTRVSTYASWIDSIVGVPQSVPEPASVFGLLAVSALGASSALKRKPKQKR